MELEVNGDNVIGDMKFVINGYVMGICKVCG